MLPSLADGGNIEATLPEGAEPSISLRVLLADLGGRERPDLDHRRWVFAPPIQEAVDAAGRHVADQILQFGTVWFRQLGQLHGDGT